LRLGEERRDSFFLECGCKGSATQLWNGVPAFLGSMASSGIPDRNTGTKSLIDITHLMLNHLT
jgi:hypothetical protein